MMNAMKKLRKAARKVTVVSVVALVATLIMPLAHANAAEVSNSETGVVTETTDGGTTTTTVKFTSGKEDKFVRYSDTDFDFSETTGTNSSEWTYRYESLTGVITITSKINGQVRNQTGYRNNSTGAIEVENYGHVVERHNFSATSWSVEKNDIWTGEFVGKVSKTLAKNGSEGTVTTVSSGDITDMFPNIVPQEPDPNVASPKPTSSATTAPTASASANPATTAPAVPTFAPPSGSPNTVPTFAPPSGSPNAVPTFVPPSTAPTATASATPPATTAPTASATPAQGEETVIIPDGNSGNSSSGNSSQPKSNFSSLRHKTKIEKKAYSSLKKLEKMAKKKGWKTKRKYTRKSSSKKKVKTTVYYKGDFGGNGYVTFRFTQVVKKVGKKYTISYYQGKKKVSTSGVYKVIQRKIK